MESLTLTKTLNVSKIIINHVLRFFGMVMPIYIGHLNIRNVTVMVCGKTCIIFILFDLRTQLKENAKICCPTVANSTSLKKYVLKIHLTVIGPWSDVELSVDSVKVQYTRHVVVTVITILACHACQDNLVMLYI